MSPAPAATGLTWNLALIADVTMLRSAAFLLCLGPCAAFAQSMSGTHVGTHVWQVVPDVTSADLAADGWSVAESAGVSGAEGSQVVVTFWERQAAYGNSVVMRCLTTLDADLNQVADVCAQARHP